MTTGIINAAMTKPKKPPMPPGMEVSTPDKPPTPAQAAPLPSAAPEPPKPASGIIGAGMAKMSMASPDSPPTGGVEPRRRALPGGPANVETAAVDGRQSSDPPTGGVEPRPAKPDPYANPNVGAPPRPGSPQNPNPAQPQAGDLNEIYRRYGSDFASNGGEWWTQAIASGQMTTADLERALQAQGLTPDPNYNPQVGAPPPPGSPQNPGPGPGDRVLPGGPTNVETAPEGGNPGDNPPPGYNPGGPPPPGSPQNPQGREPATNPLTARPPGAPQDGPLTRDVADNETVRGQLESLLSENSPLLQRARARAQERAAASGLQNSTMAAQAGEAAVMDAAMPIATADAGTYSRQALVNQDAVNNYINTGRQLEAQLTIAQMDDARVRDLAASEDARIRELAEREISSRETLTREELAQRATLAREEIRSRENIALVDAGARGNEAAARIRLGEMELEAANRRFDTEMGFRREESDRSQRNFDSEMGYRRDTTATDREFRDRQLDSQTRDNYGRLIADIQSNPNLSSEDREAAVRNINGIYGRSGSTAGGSNLFARPGGSGSGGGSNAPRPSPVDDGGGG